MRRILLVLVAVLAGVAVAVASAAVPPDERGDEVATVPAPAPPSADAPLPALTARVPLGPATLARTLGETVTRLDEATDAWRADDLSSASPPLAVTRLATYEARIVGVLATRPALGRRVLAAVPRAVARRVAPEIRALHDLHALHRISRRRPGPPPKVRLGPPEPATELLGHYRAAQRRFRVGWHVLAAVNYVESKFGRLRNESISGARGPMQFMPATWRAYGMGGDVRDPRDAIMGAANYLRASGAPRSYRRALHAYNPSELYVRTVRMYANRIARDPRAFAQLYAREVVR